MVSSVQVLGRIWIVMHMLNFVSFSLFSMSSLVRFLLFSRSIKDLLETDLPPPKIMVLPLKLSLWMFVTLSYLETLLVTSVMLSHEIFSRFQ